MQEFAHLVVLFIGGATMIVAAIAWVLILVYMFKTVAHRKPGLGLWRDAPAMNPFNHILITANLTEEGLKYRRRLGVAVLAFVVPILFTIALAAVTGDLK